MRFSLKAKMTIFLVVILLPAILIGTVNIFFSRRVVFVFEETLKRGREEILPSLELQRSIQAAIIPPNDYLVTGSRKEQIRFAGMAAEIDAAFERMSRVDPRHSAERELLQETLGYWIVTRHTAETLLALPDPKSNPMAARLMARMDYLGSRTTGALGNVFAVSQQEWEGELANATRVYDRLWQGTLLITTTGLGIGIGLLVWLTKRLIEPIVRFSEGARRLADGELGHRFEIATGDELEMLAADFNRMAIALQENHAALKHLASHDGLTGLINHREFYLRLKEGFARSQRYERPMTLLMIDLDHFKKFNDAYGHPKGDLLLKMVSEAIKESVRESDIVARYGGEEFAVLLPETAFREGFTLAERIRAKISGSGQEMVRAITGKEKSTVTASIGIASFPVDATTADRLVYVADKALYAGKNAGRNRICTVRENLSPLGSDSG